MARGQQKLQSQAKAAEKMSKMKKQQGHSATDQKKAAQKALVHVCAVCKVCVSIPIISLVQKCSCTILGTHKQIEVFRTAAPVVLVYNNLFISTKYYNLRESGRK